MGLIRVRQPRVGIVCVYLCLLWLSDAHAQSLAQLSGHVLDATGLPLVGATVTLRGLVGKATQTDSEGQFDFQGLAGGEYELSASVHGFARVRQTIQLTAGERSTVSLTLTVALLEQTVVTAEKSGEVDAQSTPIAVSVLSGDTLARMQAHTVEQVAGRAPGGHVRAEHRARSTHDPRNRH